MTPPKRKYLFFFIVLCALLFTRAAAALEQPAFDLIDEVGDLQIRRYEPHIVARTLVDSDFSEAGNQGFKRLAGYIFNGNEDDQKIAMTAPVSQRRHAKLTDISSSEEGTEVNEKFWVTFSMPRKYSLEELPKPNDDQVEIVEVPEKYVAVLKYKGNWSEERYRQHKAKLLALVEQSTIWRQLGEVTWARYNPPFMPGFMRTNEVAIEVVSVSKGNN